MLVILCGKCRDVVAKYQRQKFYTLPNKFVCEKCGSCDNVYVIGKHEFEINLTIEEGY